MWEPRAPQFYQLLGKRKTWPPGLPDLPRPLEATEPCLHLSTRLRWKLLSPEVIPAELSSGWHREANTSVPFLPIPSFLSPGPPPPSQGQRALQPLLCPSPLLTENLSDHGNARQGHQAPPVDTALRGSHKIDDSVEGTITMEPD